MKYALVLLVLLGCGSDYQGMVKETSIDGCFELQRDTFCHATQITKLVNTCSVDLRRDFKVCTAKNLLMERGYEEASLEFCGTKYTDCQIMEETYSGEGICTEIHTVCRRK